jgi:hypothetical protein
VSRPAASWGRAAQAAKAVGAGPGRRTCPARPCAASPVTGVAGPGGRAGCQRAQVRPVPDAEHVPERGQRGQFAAAAVHGRAGRGRRRAQVDAPQRGPVRVPARHRPRHHLAHGLHAAGDVADVVRVHRLLLGRGPGMPGQHQVGEPGGEPLDLGLDPCRHVHRRPGRDMAVRPERVLSPGGAGGIRRARLDHQHVRRIRVLAAGHRGLAGGDLLERAAEVQGPRVPGRLVVPRHRPGQGEVGLADAGAVAEPGQRVAVPGGQSPVRHGEETCAVRRPAASPWWAATRPATAPSGRSPPAPRRRRRPRPWRR